jgi:hypothetical protein
LGAAITSLAGSGSCKKEMMMMRAVVPMERRRTMRRTAVAFLFLFLLLGVPNLAFALTDSFRAASTGGLLEDDVDLLQDPARITEIKGKLIWTNLSNFINKDEEVFGGASRDFLLVGGAASWGTLHGALVYDRRTSRTALGSDLYDRYGNTLYGLAERQDAEFIDRDSDNSYDELVSTRERREGFQDDSEGDIYAAVAKEMGAARLGISASRYHWKSEYRYPYDGYNFLSETIRKNLITGQTLYSDLSEGTQVYKSGYTTTGVLVSYWRPIRPRLQGGVRLGMDWISHEDESKWRETEAIDYTPLLPNANTDNSLMTSEYAAPSSGLNIRGGVTGFYEWSPETEYRVFIDLARESFEWDPDALNQATATRTVLATLGSDVRTYSQNGTLDAPLSGDGSVLTGNFFGYGLRKLSDDATFAFGLRLASSSYEQTVETSEQLRMVTTYDDGDGIPTFSDYTQTVTGSQAIVNKTTSLSREFSIPVGLEFRLRKPVMLRLGAVHRETFEDATDTDVQTSYSVAVMRTEYGDGRVSETLYDSDDGLQIPGTAATAKHRSSYTEYSYGLGIQATENLQIDVMGFSQVTDLSEWRLSAVIKLR